MSEVYQLRPVYHGRYYTAAARLLACCVLAFASLVAAGWLFEIHVLRSFALDLVPMRFNSALCRGLAPEDAGPEWARIEGC